MRFDLMTGPSPWNDTAQPARDVEDAGFSGMVFTDTTQAPWMSLAAAATAAPTPQLSTGVSVAFARSPMASAGLAWELAQNTQGRFRLGLGSQVKAHVAGRSGAQTSPPGPRTRDIPQAVKVCTRPHPRPPD